MSKRILIDSKYLKYDEINKDIIYINSEGAKHIYVLRYKTGDEIYINEYKVRIEEFSKENIKVLVLEKRLETKNDIEVSLYMGYLKSDKMDFCIQKAVELGVNKIFPVITKNTVVKLDLKARTRKKERFSKIISSAIEQSGRNENVELYNIQDLNDLYNTFEDYDMVLVAYEKSKESLKKQIETFKQKKLKKIAILIGPEGGFDETEIENLEEKVKNISIVSLGKSILRAETASIACLSIVNYEFLM